MIRIGIDIGGTSTTIGIVTQDGRIMDRVQLGTREYDDPNQFCEAIATSVNHLLYDQGIPIDQMRGIGIGAPNGSFFSGCIEHAPNLRFKGVVPLVQILQPFFPDTNIVLTNDANAAALGEKEFGIAKEMNDFIMITLGTGVGSGIVSNGEVVYGHDGFAGEIGHTILYPNGRLCGCGRQGCLETYASAGGMVKTAIELLESGETSVLENIPITSLRAHDIGMAAQEGDPLALKVFDQTATHLALALANAVAHTRPEAIILFGGVTNAGSVLMDPLRAHFEEFLLSIYKKKVKLLISLLPGENAAILGAASLVK